MKFYHRTWCNYVIILTAFAVSFVAAAEEEVTGEAKQALILSTACGSHEWNDHPVLCRVVDLARVNPSVVVQILRDWALDHGLLVDIKPHQSVPELEPLRTSVSSAVLRRESSRDPNQQLPVVMAHGMGDSCFNDGMQRVTKRVSELLGGVYTTCIGTGKTQQEDTMNGYFLNMNDSVDVFAHAIQHDEKLKDGFHAMGFSQGNNVIRGYIAKYNQPPVHTFISVNGVNAGIGAVPYCRPKTAVAEGEPNIVTDEHDVSIPGMCDLLMEQASRAAYTKYAQQHSFQANYWRDPRPVALDRYKRLGQLAEWNNEGVDGVNQTLRDNWAKTSKFVWIMANQDRMVWPKEGEHWGAPDSNSDDPFQTIKPMNETEWYQKDLFGLKTAQEAGKNVFESFDGDHLQFTREDFERWVTTYFKN